MSQSDITFDVNTGLVAPDTADILASVEADYKNALGDNLSLEPSTPQGQLMTSQAAIIATKNAQLLNLASQFNPFTAQGIFQDALGYIYFLTRKTATPTVVTCTCTGLVGTVIPENSLVEMDNGTRFYSAQSVTMPQAQTIDVQFICETDGAIEVSANSVTKIISVINGWDTVNNAIAGVTGTVAETQAEFERRRYASVAKNAHGTVASVYGTIADIENVVAVVVLENRTNETKTEAGVEIDGHSIFISVYGGQDSDIAEAIYNKLDAGCGTTGSTQISYTATDYFNALYTYNITRPTATNFYIKVNFQENANTPGTIIDDIKSALIANFNGTNSSSGERVTMAQTVYASRFYNDVINAGVQELTSIEVSLDNTSFTDFVFINADLFPILTEENITVNMVEMSD